MAEKARDILEMIWNFPRFFRVFSPAGGIFRNSEPVWCPHSFLCLLFPGKGKRTAFFFCLSKKKTPDKRKETGENFRMVSPDPFYRPEPCSGLAAYGSRKCTIEFVGADEGISPYKVRREVELGEGLAAPALICSLIIASTCFAMIVFNQIIVILFLPA